MKRLPILLCLCTLPLLAQGSGTPSRSEMPSDPTIRVISAPMVKTDDSRMVKAAKAAAEARQSSEARVAINRLNLNYGPPADRSTAVSGARPAAEKTVEAAKLTFKRIEVDPYQELDAVLATTSNVKVISSTRPDKASETQKNTVQESDSAPSAPVARPD